MGGALCTPAAEPPTGMPIASSLSDIASVRPVSFDASAFLIRGRSGRSFDAFVRAMSTHRSQNGSVDAVVMVTGDSVDRGHRQPVATLRIYVASERTDDVSANDWPGFTETHKVFRRVMSSLPGDVPKEGTAVVCFDDTTRMATCVMNSASGVGVFALGEKPSPQQAEQLFFRVHDLARVILAACAMIETRWGRGSASARCEPVIQVKALRCLQVWAPRTDARSGEAARLFGESWWALLANAVALRAKSVAQHQVHLVHPDADCGEVLRLRMLPAFLAGARAIVPA